MVSYLESSSYKSYVASQKQSVDTQKQAELDSKKQSRIPTQLEKVQEAIKGPQSIQLSSSKKSSSKSSSSSNKVYTGQQPQSIDIEAQKRIATEKNTQQYYKEQAQVQADKNKQSVDPQALRRAVEQQQAQKLQASSIRASTKQESEALKEQSNIKESFKRGFKSGREFDTEALGSLRNPSADLLNSETYKDKSNPLIYSGFEQLGTIAGVGEKGAELFLTGRAFGGIATKLKNIGSVSKGIVTGTEIGIGAISTGVIGGQFIASDSRQERLDLAFKTATEGSIFISGATKGQSRAEGIILEQRRLKNIKSVEIPTSDKPFVSETKVRTEPINTEFDFNINKGVIESTKVIEKPAGFDIPERLPPTPPKGQTQIPIKSGTSRYVSAEGELYLKPSQRQLTLTGEKTTYDPLAELQAKASTPEQIGIREPKFYEKARQDIFQLKFNEQYNPVPERASRLIQVQGNLKSEPISISQDIFQTKFKTDFIPSVEIIERQPSTFTFYKPKQSLFRSKKGTIGQGSIFERTEIEIPNAFRNIISIKETPSKIDFTEYKLKSKEEPVKFVFGSFNVEQSQPQTISQSYRQNVNTESGLVQLQIPQIKSEPTIKIQSIQETYQKPTYDTDSRVRQRQKAIQIVEQIPKQVQQIKSLQIPKQITKSDLFKPQKPVRQIIPVQELPNIPRLPRFKAKQTNGYEVFVRRFGKDVSIGKAKTEAGASFRLRKELVGTARASGFVKKEGRIIPISLGKGFRKSKKDKFRVVQRRERRISSLGEKQEISRKGQLFNKFKL